MKSSFIKSAFQEGHYPPPDRPEIAFAGRSNVGKSSLINVLTNRKKLARTSSTPGRTQAINFFDVDQIYLVDLPGYGFAKVPRSVKKTWGKMVEEYLKNRINLKVVIVILDIRRDPNQGDMDLLNWLVIYGVKAVVVLTKADKLSKNKALGRARLIQKYLAKVITHKPLLFSSKTRQGKDQIWEEITTLIKT